MAHADVRVAPGGALLVDGHEVRREAHRPPAVDVEADPARDGLHRGGRARDRGATLRGEAADAAAEGGQGEVLAEAGEGLGPDARAPDDPGATALESGLDQVGVGDVLEPAGDRVEPAAAVAIRVRDPGPHPLLVGPPAGEVHELHQLRLYLSSSSESCRRSSI